MLPYEIVPLRERPEWKDRAARWFHEKWNVPLEEYRGSIDRSLAGGPVPGWYLCLSGDTIIAGAGVIENDFHQRKDLSPNVCAVYTEEPFRRQGVAGALLQFICRDMARQGVKTLYLITHHVGFYERYGWEFLCMAACDGGETARMYVHWAI